jgi:hypothetical protein
MPAPVFQPETVHAGREGKSILWKRAELLLMLDSRPVRGFRRHAATETVHTIFDLIVPTAWTQRSAKSLQ